ncbi:TVP38/TMEM64 family protein [Novosphingobium sp. TH158]|uniref:TVP38/TMEM64 family protein n=1 Tax=Novosphingobium sp. TH158 TaxID=2067455 RepID=UPI000C7E05AA|nr:VTT domain-containing protein [Novosphingobium sp. TH158]PLK26847.1 hypothetical protein C0V78_08050 [Novosphingobium sp. TH158]
MMAAARRLGLLRLGGALVALVVAAGTLIAYLPGTRHALLRMIGEVEGFFATNWLAFGMGQAIIAASGVLPASVMAVMAGAAYGMVWGFIISAAFTMLGGWLAFLLSRSLLRPLVEWLVGRTEWTQKFDAELEHEGWHFVLLLRLSPVMPFALTSYGLGLTTIRQRDFLLGTLASLPALASFVALGAMGREGLNLSLGNGDPLQWTLFVVGLVAVALVIWRTGAIVRRISGGGASASETKRREEN